MGKIRYFVVAIITAIFAVVVISGSNADSLKYSFPEEGTDFSSIAWAEVAIDENGQIFSLPYEAWDVGQIGIRMSHEGEGGSFELHLLDPTGNEQICEYAVEDLETDEEGLTWLNVGKHVASGELKLTLRNVSTEGLKVIAYSQEGVTDESGAPALRLSMQLNAVSFPKSRAYIFSLFWILVCLAGFLFMNNKCISYEKLFVIFYLVFGIMAFMVFSPLAEPDSGNHYRRTYALSENEFLPGLDENNAIGREFAWPSSWGDGDTAWVSWYEARNRMDYDVTDPANARYLTYTNIALYSPICHLIPALAMKVTRLFSHSIIVLDMAGRVLNFIAIGIVLFLGIKMAPFGKEYFLWIILHPFMMKQYTSISPDAMTAALVFLLTAVVLRLRYDPKARAEKGMLVALYVIPFFLGQFKIVYVAFCLLLFLIPVEKFASKKSYFVNAAAIGLVTIVPALLWFKVSSNILSQGYASTSSVNTKIALNVFKYVPVLMNTFVMRGYDYIMQFFGSSLLFKDTTNNLAVVIFMMLVTGLIVRNSIRNRQNTSDGAVAVRKDLLLKILVIASIAVTSLLIFTAEYVQWTDPGANNVNGVSGRYFFPFIFPGLILLTGMSDTTEVDGEALTSISCWTLYCLAAITLCFMSQLFIVYQL